MTSNHLVLLLTATLLLPACGGAQTDSCLPVVEGMDGGTPFILPDSVGSLRVPPLTTEEPLGRNSHGRRLILEDSTIIHVWVTPQPAAGLSMSGPGRVEGVRNCETQVSGHLAIVSRFTVVPRATPREYMGMMNIVLDDSTSANFTISTATVASRDMMLGVVAHSLVFRGRRR